ncbi:Type I restriction-mod (plasmid) [Ketogulonicigenium vulgare WSH-001]|uniref:Type I restriction-mod n=2 Tax=Ketogulonicigenium vulgare TaxID=92945 RepID=F9YBL2_KETVW|nr:Type I restriction-mod [Ketogulonicigenium vulgare WSH-001]ALJ82886.1 restriction endonuclease [Ketogulonicigenium vulgare]
MALENIESWTGRAIETASTFEGEGVAFKKGDILFGKLRPYLAKVHLTETDGEAVGDLWALRHQKHVDPCFAAYQLLEPGFIDRVNGSTTGAKMPRAEWGFVGSIKVPTPPLEEQTAIAIFLDRETARIDGLIKKKGRFIELLKEKRAALITHAVTKGIDAGVPMKDSGQDWLGQIPEHWDTVPPTALFTESKERAHEGDQMLSATQKYGVIPLEEFEALEQRQVTMAVTNLDKRKHTEIGDFVISMRSMDGGLERARAVGSVRSSYSVLRCGPEVEGRFFGYLLKSSLYIQALRLTTSFIRDGQDMNFSHFRKVKLPRVPVDEQIRIADHIDRETARIDGLVAKTDRSIELLKEKRSTLITAAVTGKIDVRNAA